MVVSISWLFTQRQPLYTSCDSMLLNFSRYCTIRLKIFLKSCVCFLSITCVKITINLLQYSTIEPVVLVGAFVVVVQLLHHVWPFATPWAAARQASLSFTISQSFLKHISIESVMLPNHIILCHALLLLTSVFPSIRVFSQWSALHVRWPKY